MLISCNKLKSHIKNGEDIDWLNIWDTFTLRTAEVEKVEVKGNTFDNVVVAEIKECIPHPDSDHMHILKVDCGDKELIEVVCGAPNVRVGLKTAYVKVGGHIDGMEIKARPLRGILSNGMCCSGRELGISDNHDGILDLPSDWINGTDIKEYLPIEDIIVEIDNKSLTNRPDLWGHYGIAREICAITNHELLPLDILEIKNDKEDLDIVIKDNNLCYRYTGLKIENIKNKLAEIKETLSIDKLEEELKILEKETLTQEFWNDSENMAKVLSKINNLKKKITSYKNIENEIKTLSEMLELVAEEEDSDLEKEISENLNNVEKDVEELEISTLLSEKYDENNAIVTIHPGAGGTEAQDWAEMLYRMYTRWANDNNFKIEELDYLDGEEAGLKSVTFLVSGSYAYGYLKGEHGVHRLVRISPFDSGGRRHTSFASVEVLPEINDDEDIYINPDDIKMDVYRASGAGGQHVNKTSSAVRLTHIPTGIIVACQTERSQFQNRDTAMKMLKSKLLTLKEQANKEKIEDLKGVQMDIAWGSQIRSYVFCPYTLVKDHRTNFEVGDVQSVMDGNLNGFIFAYLKYNKKNNQ